jgi:tRNA-(ms[2]io[6]A)-hydroxylase
MIPTLAATPAEWLPTVMTDFDEFLKDHASCEKKASGMALAMASHYPDQPRLLHAMVDLAVEELNHYREVVRILTQRGIAPGPDVKDPYVNRLNANVRRGPANFLMDRLLMGAVVERRGAERFALVADYFGDQKQETTLAAFYASIAASERRHWELFYELAFQHCAGDEVATRFAELCAIEADIVVSLPLRAALH